MSSVEELFEAMHAWPEVEAIALGGSRATGNADEKSENGQDHLDPSFSSESASMAFAYLNDAAPL